MVNVSITPLELSGEIEKIKVTGDSIEVAKLPFELEFSQSEPQENGSNYPNDEVLLTIPTSPKSTDKYSVRIDTQDYTSLSFDELISTLSGSLTVENQGEYYSLKNPDTLNKQIVLTAESRTTALNVNGNTHIDKKRIAFVLTSTAGA